jgi:hypothetical protein
MNRNMCGIERYILFTLYVTLPQTNKKQTRDPKSTSKLYQMSNQHLSTKFSANFCG